MSKTVFLILILLLVFVFSACEKPESEREESDLVVWCYVGCGRLEYECVCEVSTPLISKK